MRTCDRNIFPIERRKERRKEWGRKRERDTKDSWRNNCKVSWDVLVVNPSLSPVSSQMSKSSSFASFVICCLTWVHFNLQSRHITELCVFWWCKFCLSAWDLCVSVHKWTMVISLLLVVLVVMMITLQKQTPTTNTQSHTVLLSLQKDY